MWALMESGDLETAPSGSVDRLQGAPEGHVSRHRPFRQSSDTQVEFMAQSPLTSCHDCIVG